MPNLSLTELLGTPVFDVTGMVSGRVREAAIAPQEDPARIALFVVRSRRRDYILPASALKWVDLHGVRSATRRDDWTPFNSSEGLLLLERDLLDQQIIDVHGRKVVRVNDAELEEESSDSAPVLKMATVDVGARGAIRRLLKGLVPRALLHSMLQKFPPRTIPWEFVDLIETDPARRVKLKISHDRLARLHPADIADIIEELAPAEREAVLETLDEHVAADALEEVDPKLQVSIVSGLDSETAADIVQEMDPDAAADLLGDLPPERSEQILEEMEPEERGEVEELLTFEENTAAGRMTTDYLSLSPIATVNDAINQLRNYEGGVESVSNIFLVESDGKLAGVVPLSRLLLANLTTPLAELKTDPLISVPASANEKEVSETFDKYNLLSLPVVDPQGKLAGVITADDVINLLRQKE
ncbi:MAG TPA: CBS domain-containing protein [Terriglobales bacterium]|nr:CBS domain-containing protein [Terriglobales bacterium]